MGDEKTSSGWVEGGPVESLSPDAARAEIKAIEGDPNFLGEGRMTHWPRQEMLRRRDALYRHVGPDPEGEEVLPENRGLYDQLKKEGVTKESLEEDHERFKDRDAEEAAEKCKQELISFFGGEKEAKEAVQTARSVVKRFATKNDLAFLESSGLTNDPQLIAKLAEVGGILKRGGKKREDEK